MAYKVYDKCASTRFIRCSDGDSIQHRFVWSSIIFKRKNSTDFTLDVQSNRSWTIYSVHAIDQTVAYLTRNLWQRARMDEEKKIGMQKNMCGEQSAWQPAFESSEKEWKRAKERKFPLSFAPSLLNCWRIPSLNSSDGRGGQLMTQTKKNYANN